jgi:hypothetical protein
MACALAYALVLQGLLFALESGSAAIAAAQDPALAAFQLCGHGPADATLPGTPSQSPIDDAHCWLCIAGAVYVDCAQTSAPPSSEAVFATAVWPLAPTRRAAPFVNKGTWSRAPPPVA